MVEDLLKVVGECRLVGRMYEAINSTFISSSPKWTPLFLSIISGLSLSAIASIKLLPK